MRLFQAGVLAGKLQYGTAFGGSKVSKLLDFLSPGAELSTDAPRTLLFGSYRWKIWPRSWSKTGLTMPARTC